MKSISWHVVAVALTTLLGTAIIGLVGVVWAQGSEIAVQKERVDGLKQTIIEMRESLEKRLDKIDAKLEAHGEKDK